MKTLMKTLIILHGWQSSKEKWQNVKEALEEQGIRVLVLDLPGFKPENQLKQAWCLDDYVERLAEKIDEGKTGRGQTSPKLGSKFLGGLPSPSPPVFPSPVFLLGHSFGGRIAIKFAVRYPEKLQGLILVSAAGIKDNSLTTKFFWFLAGLSQKLKIKQCPCYSFARKFFYRFVLRKIDYFKANPIQKEIMKKAVSEDLTPFLKDIFVPTLIIWGRKDKTTPLKNGYLMKEKIRGAKLKILPYIGHSPHLENPGLLAEKIREFL